MNKTTINSLETEVKELRSEVKNLRNLLKKATKEKNITKDELMKSASQVFDVSSEETKDDNNVANPQKIKAVDLTSYA